MGFVQHDKVGRQYFAPMHGVIELIAQNLGGTHDDRRIRIFFTVAGQDADLLPAENRAKFSIFGIAQRF